MNLSLSWSIAIHLFLKKKYLNIHPLKSDVGRQSQGGCSMSLLTRHRWSMSQVWSVCRESPATCGLSPVT